MSSAWKERFIGLAEKEASVSQIVIYVLGIALEATDKWQIIHVKQVVLKIVVNFSTIYITEVLFPCYDGIDRNKIIGGAVSIL